MTQNYYVDNLLPVNVEAVKSIRLIDDKIMAFTREWGPFPWDKEIWTSTGAQEGPQYLKLTGPSCPESRS